MIATCLGLSFFLLFSDAPRAVAGFSSIYVFGDSVSTTTNNVSSVPQLYYGRRFCNGRVWVELLAERQGIAYVAAKNWSYFGHYSSDLLANINRFTTSDASTSLFVVWVNDADFVYALNHIDPPYRTNLNIGAWNSILNQSLTNHALAIQRLYAKGARNFIMPNAVDVAKAPYYINMPLADRRFIRDRVMSYNIGFSAVINQAKTSLPDLTIHVPDFFGLLDDIHAHPGNYGLVNSGVGATEDPALPNKSLNGPGANYIFWDYLNPSAKSHAHMVSMAQQLLSPVRIQSLTAIEGGNRLDILNVPIGTDGFAEMSPDMTNWAAGPLIDSTNVTQNLLVPISGPRQFYRLCFPFSWTWP